MTYAPQLRRIKVKCPNCINGSQVCNSDQKTRLCSYCGHVIDVQKNIVKKEVW